ncbi:MULTISPECIES: DUF6458 family protein [Streptomyces]|uniref:DUF6458 domain-containing protein n=1 Tax=Streptomyces albus (strain ATCC 21838 / DSM 41398 / FERM P-419 / JCM 4703 / NBRC 107858) TaxID=1081613 RepID=A0A0B5EMZ2_STRA4|nr:DUF6458 family protein [Streptomyces sp. SCSIO ZS0520]AJE83903.1 hypothetical protein SLNWT_3527 [Streptomyces albus]AOU78207.1 hypothetical protein SLNHY_3516 [Streptomyces albus]AYN33960.1 hypothetical protein DUI70_3459 [Streptomyces albus]
MGLGGSILLIAVGAILAFATDWDIDGANVNLIGVILMAAGLLGVAAFTSIYKRRRAVVPQATVIEDRHQNPL